MWKRVAVLSLILNAFLAGGLVAFGHFTRTVEGELWVPRLDLSGLVDPEKFNTWEIGVETADGHFWCRTVGVDAIVHSKQNVYASQPARVSVEIDYSWDLDPRCRSILTLREGWVHQPK